MTIGTPSKVIHTQTKNDLNADMNITFTYRQGIINVMWSPDILFGYCYVYQDGVKFSLGGRAPDNIQSPTHFTIYLYSKKYQEKGNTPSLFLSQLTMKLLSEMC